MKKFNYAAVCLLTLLGITSAYAAESNSQLLRRANNGDVDAQRILAKRLLKGTNGAPVQKKNAVLWLEKAAEQDDAQAMFILGVLYETGNGVAKNLRKAEEYYQAAAEEGYEKAEKKLKSAPFKKTDDDDEDEDDDDDDDEDEATEKAPVPAKANKKEPAEAKGSQKKSAEEDEPSPANEEDESEEESEPEESGTSISRGGPNKEPLPYTRPDRSRSGKCEFIGDGVQAIRMGDGRIVYSDKLILLENKTALVARENAKSALDVKAAKGWITMAEYVERHDFSSDPVFLCFIHASALFGNDNFAYRIRCSKDQLSFPKISTATQVQDVIKEDLLFLQSE